MNSHQYNIGDPIEYVDKIDNSIYKGSIVFIEYFMGKQLLYVKYDEEKRNIYDDSRFPNILYGDIIPVSAD